LRSIDALRGVAALGVVLYHAVRQTANGVPDNFFAWPVKTIQFVTSFGYIGVFLFFVISGFCIHLQWAKAQADGKSSEIKFVAFWKRRIRRLYPPYLITLGLFLVFTLLTGVLTVSYFFFYDLATHLLMVHNLDHRTVYSINGVFWTLAIEEQLYLAYFLLLFMRKKWGWIPTLIVCLLARVGWVGFSHVVWLKTGFGLPFPEAAASHWFTWALGAVAVEAAFGLIQLPKWCRNLRLGVTAILLASAVSVTLPYLHKDGPVHEISWLLMHPVWGFGFFVILNRAVEAERSWLSSAQTPRLIAGAATIGLFSYSLYLTHELVIMNSWRFVSPYLPNMLNTFLIIVPATVVFAWIFFWFCERPYLRKSEKKQEASFSTAPPPPEAIPETIGSN
jgi:peptidoglycan/LPS O-acetylase OafA/YrhL